MIYDGFGNRKNQNVTHGTGPNTPSYTFSPATNRINTAGYGYDTNGNLTATPGGSGVGASLSYDIANRLATHLFFNGFPTEYAYDAANKRIRKCHQCDQPTADEEFYFYGMSGELLAAYRLEQIGSSYKFEQRWTNVYFAGKLIKAKDWVLTDRQGSVRWRETHGAFAYYPYGEARLGPGYGDNAYATYFRDSPTNRDYADQRYYQFNSARFLTADPYQGSAGPSDPGSWNRYAYVQGDPVNSNDPSGLLTLIIGGTALQPWGRSTAGWGAPGSELHDMISDHFGEEAIVFPWRGQLWERDSASQSLFNYISAYTFEEGETLNIVAHSHGGNVVKDYTWLTGARKIDTLITLGTPQRGDYIANGANLGTYLNVYSKHDNVQIKGGDWFNWGRTSAIGYASAQGAGGLGSNLAAIATGGIYSLGVVKGWWGRTAGRTDRCAVDIGIDRAPGLGNVSHEELHTPQVWQQMLGWMTRAGHGLSPSELSYCHNGFHF